jgi:beta-xylosidase
MSSQPDVKPRRDVKPAPGPWHDASRPPDERVRALVAEMTLEEKVSQLYGIWVGMDASPGEMAPHQHEMLPEVMDWDDAICDGIGQLTRPFGTAPVEPAVGARTLAEAQRQVAGASRFGIPALVHEECLTGLAAWQATVFPSPLCWAASFDPDLVEAMAGRIGETMRGLGVHQGLAPVLDVVRDLRWGRVEETMGEDPHLVGLIGSAYVRGLESAGIVATLKHFLGYSASTGGRNLAPVSIGERELADVLLPPFEMALRAGARSVMNAYTATDGIPVGGDPSTLDVLLRQSLRFTGTVVADYFAVTFLQTLHGVAGSAKEAAVQALRAGIDVELPTVNCFGTPLLEAVGDDGTLQAFVDRAVARVLRQKCELGLLDSDWTPERDLPPGGETLDPPESRAVAGDLARRSVVLLSNDGTLPLAPSLRLAVVGPRAHDPRAMLGCYSFPMHVGVHHPQVSMGVEIASLVDALRRDPAGYQVEFREGCPVLGGDDEGIAAAARAAEEADVCVAVLGDRAGLFGGGTSGEGCDAPDLALPGRQAELLDALLATGTPVVLVLLVGRPYELSRHADRLAATVCGFFPGEEGAPALADVLSGRTNPSGRLPVSFPRAGGTQPGTYLAARLARRSEVSVVDPTPLFPFGHGMTYAPVTWTGVERVTGPEWGTDGVCRIALGLANESDRASSEVVQIYLHDPVASVVRPVVRLIACARVDLEPGERARVEVAMHADLTSFTGRSKARIVEPGPVELRVGASSSDIRAVVEVELTGDVREVGPERHLTPEVTVERGSPS